MFFPDFCHNLYLSSPLDQDKTLPLVGEFFVTDGYDWA
jgi:hypothetical protein